MPVLGRHPPLTYVCVFLAPPPTVDKLIHYVNLDGRVNVFYSTPAILTKSLNDANVTWSVKVRVRCAVLLLLLLLISCVCPCVRVCRRTISSPSAPSLTCTGVGTSPPAPR